MDERTYINQLKKDLVKLKNAIDNKNLTLDCEYCEIEADIESIYLWKEASKEEVEEIIEEYDFNDDTKSRLFDRVNKIYN